MAWSLSSRDIWANGSSTAIVNTPPALPSMDSRWIAQRQPMTTHPVKRRKKLIELAIPLEAINATSAPSL
jgi:hypothetical protein